MSRYNKGKHSKKCIKSLKILSLIFITICIMCAIIIIYNIKMANENKSIYDEISVDNEISQDENITDNIHKVRSTKQENEDIKGWIQIENTIIDYPILQGIDNKYYLTRNYKKENSIYGSLFMHKDCNINDDFSNVIIYGHNMKDGQMFNELLKYKDKSFYNEHKTINIATENKESTYSILSVFKSRVFYQDEKNVFRYYNYTRFDSQEIFNSFIENCKKIQLYDTNETVEYGEQIITLITCEYSQENGRMVVVAKKIN